MILPIKEHILVELKQTTLVQEDAGVGTHQEGDVVAVGDEVTYVSVGDHIIWQQYSESNIFERDGKQLTLLLEANVMAKEQDAPENTN
jgi:co-chaperonin GroES (HSP10)